jgi:molybdate transport system ATP-binding protein
VNGRVWFDASAGLFVPPHVRRIGYVAQDLALFPHLTVAENVAYGLRGLPGAVRRDRTDALLALVGLRGLEGRLPRQLSGGQGQRVALARAVAPDPQLLLLDEPFGALDALTRRELRSELHGWLRETGTSAILVTHDRIEAMSMGDDLAVLVDGRLRQVGHVADVFNRPADSAVARALGVETVLPAVVESFDAGLVTLRVGRGRLLAVAGSECAAGDDVFACVRAEDVGLERGVGTAGSARNRISGQVVGIEREGPIDRVALDCGFPLVAAVTWRTREELALEPGGVVTVAIKATAIHIVPKV